jgi:hypothetical protein
MIFAFASCKKVEEVLHIDEIKSYLQTQIEARRKKLMDNVTLQLVKEKENMLVKQEEHEILNHIC